MLKDIMRQKRDNGIMNEVNMCDIFSSGFKMFLFNFSQCVIHHYTAIFF